MTIPEKTPAEVEHKKERETLPTVTLRGLHDMKRLMKGAEYRGKQSIKVGHPLTVHLSAWSSCSGFTQLQLAPA